MPDPLRPSSRPSPRQGGVAFSLKGRGSLSLAREHTESQEVGGTWQGVRPARALTSRGGRNGGSGVAFALLGGSLLLCACSQKPLSADQIDVVATVTAPGQDFGDLRTFALPARLSEICSTAGGGAGGASGVSTGGGTGMGCVEPDHSRDSTVIGSLRTEMTKLGYVEVDATATPTPDVVLLAGLVAQPYLSVRDEGVPWCDASPLFSGCWQPDYDYSYRLEAGTVVIDMAVTAESEDGIIHSAWTAVLANLMTFEVPSTGTVGARVEQAFTQSLAKAEVAK